MLLGFAYSAVSSMLFWLGFVLDLVGFYLVECVSCFELLRRVR